MGFSGIWSSSSLIYLTRAKFSHSLAFRTNWECSRSLLRRANERNVSYRFLSASFTQLLLTIDPCWMACRENSRCSHEPLKRRRTEVVWVSECSGWSKCKLTSTLTAVKTQHTCWLQLSLLGVWWWTEAPSLVVVRFHRKVSEPTEVQALPSQRVSWQQRFLLLLHWRTLWCSSRSGELRLYSLPPTFSSLASQWLIWDRADNRPAFLHIKHSGTHGRRGIFLQGNSRVFGCSYLPGRHITVDSDSHKCGAVHCPTRPSEVQRSSHDETCLCCHCGDVACWHQCGCRWSYFDLPNSQHRIGDHHPPVSRRYRLLLHQNPPGRPSAPSSDQRPGTRTDWTATRREFVRHEGV